MNEFFKNRIDTAHALIDEGQYEAAVELIQNLKTRIHDTGVLTQIHMHDTETNKEYDIRLQNLSMKAGDPTQSFYQLQMLKKWKSQEYLKYYDLMLREHDI